MAKTLLVRRAVLLLLLAVLVAPASAAQACDIIQVETLETVLPTAPTAVAAGRTLPLRVRVTRADQPAAGVNVFAVLRGADFTAYRSGVTNGQGNVTLPLAVPRDARGGAELDVEAYREVVHLPCAQIEEYDRRTEAWGRVR